MSRCGGPCRGGVLALAAALLGVLSLGACTTEVPAPRRRDPGPQRLLLPAQGAYTGAYVDFGETEDDVTLEAIERFETLVGKKQAIVASSSYWGKQSFPADNVALVFRHGAIPLVFWSPWNAPYREYEEAQGDRAAHVSREMFSLTNIIDGKWNAYIDRWADGAKAFGQPLLVSFGNEMNGLWFPWSGGFYGAGEAVPGAGPPRWRGSETFKTAWRHVVDRVRARGATNIQWVFHAVNYSYPREAWNTFAAYYPGREYVDWLGLSVYGKQMGRDRWAPFPPLLDVPYRELAALDPDMPMMIAEWGVGEFPKAGDKAAWIRSAFAEMKRYPRLKAAVFWHERWENADGSFSNLRVSSSPEALAAYREGVADPFWLAAPVLAPAKAQTATQQPSPH